MVLSKNRQDESYDVFSVCWPELLIFNRLRAIWPKGYQRGSIKLLVLNSQN